MQTELSLHKDGALGQGVGIHVANRPSAAPVAGEGDFRGAPRGPRPLGLGAGLLERLIPRARGRELDRRRLLLLPRGRSWMGTFGVRDWGW